MQLLHLEKFPLRPLEDGIYAASLTPMHADLSCHSQELADHCQDLVQRGCKGVILFGTTGEGPSFSVQERLEALEQVIEEGLDPQKIILGNGGANIPETVVLALGALKCHASTLLVAPPSFFKNVSEEGVIAFYREIIHRVHNPNLRVILYHIPQFSGVPITLKIIETLRLEFPNTIIGIKESEGNLAFAKAVIKTFPGFKVFVGNERQIIEAVAHGASGAFCGLANLYPELMCSLCEQGKQSKSPNPQELEVFFEALKEYHFIPAFKTLMEKKRGAAWYNIRPPLIPLTPAQSDKFTSSLELNSI
jgi:4-hydroxy-tetrahydrodipicolinate synthase